MNAPRLIVITDTERAAVQEWLNCLTPLLFGARPASVMVQLRDRELEFDARHAFGERLRRLTRTSGQLFSVNDRLDLALLLEADGVHLPRAGIPAPAARRLLTRQRPNWFLTQACHVPAELAIAEVDGVLLSPMLEARKGRPPLGEAGLERALAARRARTVGRACRIYALGGVRPGSARALLDAGADGIAVIGAALDARGPEPLLHALGIER